MPVHESWNAVRLLPAFEGHKKRGSDWLRTVWQCSSVWKRSSGETDKYFLI